MVFKRFAFQLALRVLMLTVTLAGLSFSLIATGYYALILLLLSAVLLQTVDLYRCVNKTNTELARFLSALRYTEFGQRFQSGAKGGEFYDADFARLSETCSEIMAQLKTSRQQQESQLQYLKAMTEHTPVPLLSVYPDGLLQLHNNAARRMFGNITVNRVEDLCVFSNDFCEAIKNIEPGVRKLIQFSQDGMDRQLAVVATTIVHPSRLNAPSSEKLVSLLDIQSELDKAQLQAWQDLVRVLTHEIMNTITPVASLARTARELIDDTRNRLHANSDIVTALQELTDVRQAIDIVTQRSDGLMQFVQSYRSLTQITVPNKQKILIAAVFERIRELYDAQWQSSGIEFSVVADPDNLSLYADPDLLEQVLINLLQNAEQALASVESPRVSLSACLNPRGNVLISVSDNGPGISSDVLGKIFVPFFTTKHQGTGVGLALTRQIMIAHGGNVAVTRPEDGGVTFTLLF